MTSKAVPAARFKAWSEVEFAVATGEGHEALYGAIERATRAAYEEGKEGVEWVPYRAVVPVVVVEEKKKGGWSVSPADGFWMAVRSGAVKPPGPPFVVYREGETVDTTTLAGVVALCPTKEDAELVRRALCGMAE